MQNNPKTHPKVQLLLQKWGYNICFCFHVVFAVPYTIEALLQQICIIFNGGCISKLIWNDGTVALV